MSKNEELTRIFGVFEKSDVPAGAKALLTWKKRPREVLMRTDLERCFVEMLELWGNPPEVVALGRKLLRIRPRGRGPRTERTKTKWMAAVLYVREHPRATHYEVARVCGVFPRQVKEWRTKDPAFFFAVRGVVPNYADFLMYRKGRANP